MDFLKIAFCLIIGFMPIASSAQDLDCSDCPRSACFPSIKSGCVSCCQYGLVLEIVNSATKKELKRIAGFDNSTTRELFKFRNSADQIDADPNSGYILLEKQVFYDALTNYVEEAQNEERALFYMEKGSQERRDQFKSILSGEEII